MLSESFALHALTSDERATAMSMLAREATGRMLAMPTHHFGDYGDFTGFRYDCAGTAAGSCLPVSRRMFYGHTLVECLDGEQEILRLMSQPGENRRLMREFLEETEERCVPALLDCIPDNSDALMGRGVLQAGSSTPCLFQKCPICAQTCFACSSDIWIFHVDHQACSSAQMGFLTLHASI